MLTEEKVKAMKAFSVHIQMEVVKMIASLGVGHLGGSLSVADLVAVLYEGGQFRYNPQNPQDQNRDWLVCSKGHAGPSLYAALAMKGFMPMEELETLNRPKTRLPSHCDRNRTPGVDMTTGSLGQGASTAAGVALGHLMNGAPNRVFLILGDGECDEGQVWEMAMAASTKRLHNLIAFVDQNHLQLDGPTEEICALGDLAERFSAFGWHTQKVNGHDVAAIYNAIEAAFVSTQPSMIVLDTIKGHGWSEVEGKASSHSMTVSPEQLNRALSEMQARLDVICGQEGCEE